MATEHSVYHFQEVGMEVGNLMNNIGIYSEIDKATDMLHDCRFNIEHIEFDRAANLCIITFECPSYESRVYQWKWFFLKKWQIPVHMVLLKFFGIKDINIKDTEKIGEYDLNEIHFSEKDGKIVITTGVPLKFELFGDSISLEIIDKGLTGKFISKYSIFE